MVLSFPPRVRRLPPHFFHGSPVNTEVINVQPVRFEPNALQDVLGVRADQGQFEVANRHIESARSECSVSVAAVYFSLIVDIKESPVTTSYFQVYGSRSIVAGCQVESDGVRSSALQVVGTDVLPKENPSGLRHDHETGVTEVDVGVEVLVKAYPVLVVVELKERRVGAFERILL